MEVLQRPHADLTTLQGRDTFSGGPSGSQGRDGGNVVHDCGSANGLLVKPRLQAVWGIDHQLDLLAFDEVYNVRSTFFYLVDAIGNQPGPFEQVGGAVSGNQT